MNICPSDDDLRGWLEGGADGDTDPGLIAHLEGCGRCQEVLERLTALGPDAMPGRTVPFAGSDSRNDMNDSSPGGEKLARLRCLMSDNAGRTSQAPTGPDWPVVSGYEIEGELGRGGMGVVYQARQLSPNRVVALKMIQAGMHATSEEVVRFRVEGETVARLQHPNIIQIYEVGAHAGRPYLAMEFVAGGNLEAHLAGRPQPPRAAARLIETLARAMHHAHERGIIHRDLKPANVLLASPEVNGQDSSPTPHHSPLTTHQPKITDFGLARLMDADLQLTRTGAVAGTPAYMAPEQARPGRDAVRPAADVYALGAVLYECLTGRPPFVADTPLQVLQQVVDADPVPPSRLAPGVPRDLETVCLHCLRKEPHRRYASARDLAEDLGRFLEGRPVRARPLGPLGRAQRWCRRNPFLAAAVATVAATALVAFFWINAEKNAAHELAEENARGQKAAQALAEENARLARKEGAARRQVQGALVKQTAALTQRDAAARRSKAIIDYLIRDMLGSADPRGNRGEPLMVRAVLDRAAAGVERAFAGQPDVEEVVRDMLGRAYLNVGQPRAALAQFTARVDVCRRLFGAAHPSTWDARGERLRALQSCGDFPAVVKESAELLPVLRKALGPEHTLTLRVLSESAKAQHHLGQLAEARRTLEEVAAVRRRLQGPEHEDTLDPLSDLATVLVKSGRPAEACKLCEEMLPISRRTLGPEHRTTLVLRNQRALSLMALGRLDESQKECEELLPALRRTAGPHHLDTLLATNNLACLLLLRQRLPDACRLFEECLPPLRRLLGEESPQVLLVAQCQGVCLSRLGRYAEAEPLYAGLLKVQRRLLAPQNPLRLNSVAQYAVALQKQDKHAAAEPVWRELLDGRRKALPAEHWQVGEAEVTLGGCLVRQARYADAEPLLLAGHGRLTRAGAPAAAVLQAVHLLVRLYEGQGNAAQAARWRARLNPAPAPPK